MSGVDVHLVVPTSSPTPSATGTPVRTPTADGPRSGLPHTGAELLAVLLVALLLVALGALLHRRGRARPARP